MHTSKIHNCNTSVYRLKIVFISVFYTYLVSVLHPVSMYAQMDTTELPEYLELLLKSARKDSSIVDSLNDAGRDYVRLSAQVAEKFSEKALEIATKIRYKAGEARAINNLGNIYYQQGQQELALANYHIALDIRDSIGDLKGSASTLNNISNIYNNQRLYHKALEYIRQSVGIYNTIKDANGLALSYLSIGGVFNTMGIHDSSIFYTKRGIYFARETGQKYLLSNGLANLGTAFGARGDRDSARYYLTTALEMKREMKEYVNLGNCIHSYVSQVLLPEKQYGEALKVIAEGIESARIIESLEIELRLTELEYTVYKESGDITKAFQALEHAFTLKDSVVQRTINEQISQVELKAYYDRRQKELALQTQKQASETKIQRIIIYSVLFLLMIAALLVFILFRQSKVRKESNTQLRLLNASILHQNRLIEEQKNHLGNQHKTITDSIHYASRIQHALMPADQDFQKHFPHSSIVYRPRDVVSGDFYWIGQSASYTFLAVGDGTGHGVPGAFMSLIGINLLKEVILKDKVHEPSQILSRMDELLNLTLRTQKGEEIPDGMDIALIRINSPNSITFSAASRPLWVKSENGIAVYKSGRHSLGGFIQEEKEFPQIEIKVQPDDLIFMFTDGITDQLGGPKKRKITSMGIQKIIEAQREHTPDELMQKIMQKFDTWKGQNKQVDDVIITCIALK
jgi:serine phosphatase RsbU (regulator of sigma subunit)